MHLNQILELSKIRMPKKEKTYSESEANWKKLLIYLYNSTDKLIWPYTQNQFGIKIFQKNHRLVKNLNLNSAKLSLAVRYLEKNKLVTYYKKKIEGINLEYFSLTEKGFNIAFQLEKENEDSKNRKKQEQTNILITIATIIIALSGIPEILNYFGIRRDYILFLILLVSILVLIVIITKSVVHILKEKKWRMKQPFFSSRVAKQYVGAFFGGIFVATYFRLSSESSFLMNIAYGLILFFGGMVVVQWFYNIIDRKTIDLGENKE
jgi:hypothetical protein